MTFFNSIFLGIIEGFTEFLPVSSTGHLILSSYLLNIRQSDFLTSFEIAIQLGAIAAVVVLYFKTLLFNAEVIKRIFVAFLPTAIIGFLLYGFIKETLLDSETTVLWSLLLGGIVLIVFELWYGKKAPMKDKSITDISYSHSLLIGLFQAVSIIPGVSRAGATILGGLWLGMPRKTIVEFSFLLAVPTMAGATGLDLLKNLSSFSGNQNGLILAGFAVSFLMAIAAIKFLLAFIQKHTFISFGIYRIILAVVFFLFLV